MIEVLFCYPSRIQPREGVEYVEAARVNENAFTLKAKVHVLPHVGDKVRLQMTVKGGAPVDLIPWRVDSIEHRISDGDGRGMLADPHAIWVFIS